MRQSEAAIAFRSSNCSTGKGTRPAGFCTCASASRVACRAYPSVPAPYHPACAHPHTGYCFAVLFRRGSSCPAAVLDQVHSSYPWLPATCHPLHKFIVRKDAAEGHNPMASCNTAAAALELSHMASISVPSLCESRLLPLAAHAVLTNVRSSRHLGAAAITPSSRIPPSQCEQCAHPYC